MADVGKRVIRVELSVCLVLLEAIHSHRIDQALDDAAITFNTRRLLLLLLLLLLVAALKT